jgi:hypothetical protein
MRDVVHLVEESPESHDVRLREGHAPNRRDPQNPHQIVLLRDPCVTDPGLIEAETTPVAKPDSASDHDRTGLTAARGVGYGLVFGGALWALMVLLWRLV